MTRVDTAIRAVELELRANGELRRWLRSRRWCGDALAPKTEVSVKDSAVLNASDTEALVWFLATAREGKVTVPLNLLFLVTDHAETSDGFSFEAAGVRWSLLEAEPSEVFARFATDGFRTGMTMRTKGNDLLSFRGDRWSRFRGIGPPMNTDSSNILVRFLTEDREVLFKSYKLMDAHNREPDIVQRLHRKGFANVPAYFGEFTLGKSTDRVSLGIALQFLETVDLFAWLTERWRTALRPEATITDLHDATLRLAAELGERTARLHAALIDDHAGPFQRETFTSEDAAAAQRAALSNLSDALARLAVLARGGDKALAGPAGTAREMVLENRERIEGVLSGITLTIGTAKCVTHADLHLGQVLRTQGGTLLFVDFEGEPERIPGRRHEKLPPLRDIATLCRSFSYVAHYAWREFARGEASAALRLMTGEVLAPEESSVADRLVAWQHAASERCSRSYLENSSLYRDLGAKDAIATIRAWMMEKALYEVRYELKHRPANVFIPLEGIMALAAPSVGPDIAP